MPPSCMQSLKKRPAASLVSLYVICNRPPAGWLDDGVKRLGPAAGWGLLVAAAVAAAAAAAVAAVAAAAGGVGGSLTGMRGGVEPCEMPVAARSPGVEGQAEAGPSLLPSPSPRVDRVDGVELGPVAPV